MNKEKIKDLISEGLTEKSLDVLHDTVNKTNAFYNEITILKARFNQLNKENRLGVIDSDSFKIEQNKINLSILELLPKLEKVNNTHKNSKLKTYIYYFIVAFGLVILILMGQYILNDQTNGVKDLRMSETQKLENTEIEQKLVPNSTNPNLEEIKDSETINTSELKDKKIEDNSLHNQSHSNHNSVKKSKIRQKTKAPLPKNIHFNTIGVEDVVTLVYSSKKFNLLDTFKISHNERVEVLKEVIKRNYNITLDSEILRDFHYANEKLIANNRILSDNLTLKEAGVKSYDIIQYEIEYKYKVVSTPPPSINLSAYISETFSSEPVLIINNRYKGILLEVNEDTAKFEFRRLRSSYAYDFRLIDGSDVIEFKDSVKMKRKIGAQGFIIHVNKKRLSKLYSK